MNWHDLEAKMGISHPKLSKIPILDDKVALGHRRLSIIDLNTGNQPIFNEDKSIVIVFDVFKFTF